MVKGQWVMVINKMHIPAAGFLVLLACIFFIPSCNAQETDVKKLPVKITLPKPNLKANMSFEEAVSKRRSVRSFAPKDLTLQQISQLLWSAQGITDSSRGFRSVPSAGALYPLEIYAVYSEGVFHYLPYSHQLERLSDKDARPYLADAAWGQAAVKEAALDIVISAVYQRVTSKYGLRGTRYVDMEAGHCSQNIQLEAVCLGLASVGIGAFSDEEISACLNLPKDHQPLYIIPVGYKE